MSPINVRYDFIIANIADITGIVFLYIGISHFIFNYFEYTTWLWACRNVLLAQTVKINKKFIFFKTT